MSGFIQKKLRQKFVIPAALILIAAGDTNPSQMAVDPLPLFARCYSHITQMSLPPNHPLVTRVESSQISPVDACMQILNSAQLATSGTNEGKLVTDNLESRAVLKTFNDMHRLWFPNDDMTVALKLGDHVWHKDAQLHDQEESALHITRTLFTSGIPYSEIITGDSGMEALRMGGPSQFDVGRAANQKIEHQSSPEPYVEDLQSIPLNAELIQVGELLGVRPLKRNLSKTNQIINSTHQPYINNRYNKYGRSILLHESFGAGIIGTTSYLLMNIGRMDTFPSDGGVRMNRRWASVVYRDILCRDLPVVRLSDAISYVNHDPIDITPPFRKSASCMGCHTSMDGMAAAARNIAYTTVGGATQGSVQLYNWTPSKPVISEPVDQDFDFFRRPPAGSLYFRSFDGTLINQPVQGIAQLGDAIATTDDLYVCAASRYFEYFTGIGVNLQDIGDGSNAILSDSELYYRNYVIQLGRDLKSHQSLKTLVRQILSSPLYGKASMRDMN